MGGVAANPFPREYKEDVRIKLKLVSKKGGGTWCFTVAPEKLPKRLCLGVATKDERYQTDQDSKARRYLSPWGSAYCIVSKSC